MAVGTIRELIGSTRLAVPFVFHETDHADAAETFEGQEASSNAYTMPFAGQVVAMSTRSNADLTGGTIVVNPTIDGVADTDLGNTLADAAQQDYDVVAPGSVTFTAGQLLGVLTSKTGTVAPTTADVSTILIVVFDLP